MDDLIYIKEYKGHHIQGRRTSVWISMNL